MVSKTLRPVSPKDVRITGKFWHQYQELVRTQTIPYQWDALNDFGLTASDAAVNTAGVFDRLKEDGGLDGEPNSVDGGAPSHCIHNFRVAAGLEEGEFQGEFFQDSDLYKWMEAAAWSLMWHPDADLEAKVDYVVDLIEAAQLPDGYVNTFYILKAGVENRFHNLRSHHELYCMGHMIEAAVAYFKATGKRKFLDVSCRMVDCVIEHIGPKEGQIHGYPGHALAEMALMELWEVTGEQKHLDLARYFVDERGQEPLYFYWEQDYYGNPFHWADTYQKMQQFQGGKPVLQQTSPEGHAVRAAYLYTGVAEVAAATGDEALFDVCRQAFEAIRTKQMYITGGIGASEHGEGFTFDYDLPNDTAYAETCAAIGLAFFARRMFEITRDARYVDVMERALYNGMISGISLDGKRFFYVNPLETDPEACERDYNKRHVKPERQKWFACACCPPNLARTVASLAAYAYEADDTTAYLSLYVGGTAKLTLAGTDVRLETTTNYPWDGAVRVEVAPEQPAEFGLALRIPDWCRTYELRVNGEAVSAAPEKGYVTLARTWQAGDAVELELAMPVRLVRAHPRVRDDAGKLAVMRGPLVYCAEQVDNGARLEELRVDPRADFQAEFCPYLLGGVVRIEAPGERVSEDGWDGLLYVDDAEYALDDAELVFVPYYAWGNRGLGEMSVWLRG